MYVSVISCWHLTNIHKKHLVGLNYRHCINGRLIIITVLFCSLAVLDARFGHTMDVLSPFISVLCHSD